jgi:hypothetical protein
VKRRPLTERFWSKVDRRGPDECWPWLASLRTGEGYGNFTIDGSKVDAHRVAWWLTEGAIPIGFVVRHRCGIKRCVNPGHLELGTHQENIQDWIASGCPPRLRLPKKPRATIAERFWAKVARGRSCWQWQGGQFPGSYGRFALNERSHVLAHRVAWQLERGAIPDGQCVLHHCDNPGCVRPSHLWLGTVADNNADRTSKGRGASGDRNGSRLYPERLMRGFDWVPAESRRRAQRLVRERYPELRRGERNGRARLTYPRAEEARRLHAAGMAARALARQFGVGKTTMMHLLAGRTWA